MSISTKFYLFYRYINGLTFKFKVGDSVQLNEGGPLMIVTAIHCSWKMPRPLIDCMWSKDNVRRSNLFLETNLKAFDWYNP